MDGDRVPLTVVIAEDSALLRDGLVNLLSRYGHTVAAAVNDADSLLAATAEHDPDIVITDVRMPPGHTDEGLRGTRTPCATTGAAHPGAEPDRGEGLRLRTPRQQYLLHRLPAEGPGG